MDTIKLTMQGKPLMVAHRGVSDLETENTAAAFVAAGNRSYYGIECDVHRTRDGKYAVLHDHDTLRVSGKELRVAEHTLAELQQLVLLDKLTGAPTRTDLRIPSLEEYIAICKKYGKYAVLELKDDFEKTQIYEICDIIKAAGWLEYTVFISFCFQNLVYLRKKYKTQAAQFLKSHWEDDLIDRVKAQNLDLDFNHQNLTREMVDACHKNGIVLNVWTVNDPARAKELAEWGVDMVTSNILE